MSETLNPAADLVAALAELTDPRKGGKATVPGRQSYTYLELPGLLQAVRDTLKKHRLAVMQELTADGGDVTVVTVLMHASGERFVSPPCTIRTRGAAQDIGSAATYARRYSLAAFVGLAGSDDDDGAAVTPPPATIPPPQPQTTARRRSTVTDDQIRGIWTKLGLLERAHGRHLTDAAKHIYIGQLVGMPDLQSTRELTKEQASTVIDQLQQRLDGLPTTSGEHPAPVQGELQGDGDE